MPGCCTRPDYDSFHEYRQLQSILYLTYSSFLHCYNQETLVCLCQVQTLASLMQKWVCFLQNVDVVQFFSRAIIILCPHNVQHLPTPLVRSLRAGVGSSITTYRVRMKLGHELFKFSEAVHDY